MALTESTIKSTDRAMIEYAYRFTTSNSVINSNGLDHVGRIIDAALHVHPQKR
jgi:hypothetical protein